MIPKESGIVIGSSSSLEIRRRSIQKSGTFLIASSGLIFEATPTEPVEAMIVPTATYRHLPTKQRR